MAIVLRVAYTTAGFTATRDFPVTVAPARVQIGGPDQISAGVPEPFLIETRPSGGDLAISLTPDTRGSFRVLDETPTETLIEVTGLDLGPLEIEARCTLPGKPAVSARLGVEVGPGIRLTGPSEIFVGDTDTALTLSITESVNDNPGPTDNFFVLQDTAAVGTGEFSATVQFPVASGPSQRTLAFVPDSATKPGGLLDIQVTVEEPFMDTRTFLVTLAIEITPEGSAGPGGEDPGPGVPEIIGFTGQFDALSVQAGGSIIVPHGTQGDLEAVGSPDVDAITIEESSIELDAFGVPVGTPITSLVASGLNGTDPPSLQTTLAPPTDSSVVIHRELTATPFDSSGDPGISSTFTVTYEPTAGLTLEITNLNPQGDLGNTVTSEDSTLVIGTVAGEPVKVVLSSASEAQLLTLYQDEFPIADEVGPVTRLPALPGTFIDVTMPPGSTYGTRIVMRGESLVDVGGNPVSTSTPEVEIQADNRPEVTHLVPESAFGTDTGGGNLSDGFIEVSFDFADPDEFAFPFDAVETITLTAFSDNGPAGQLDLSDTRTFGFGSSIGEFHSFTFDASAGMNVDSQITVTATPVDSFGLPGATASITFRPGDILVP